MRTLCVMVAAVVAVAACAAGARGQPPAAGSGEGASQTAAQPGPDEARAALKERLQRRLETATRIQQRLAQAIAALDAGKAPGEVRRELEQDMRPLLREGAGMRDGPRGERDPMRRPGVRGDGPDRREGPGPRDGQGRHGGPPGAGPLDRPGLLAMIERTSPEFARRLRDAARENPQAAERIWERLEPQLRGVLQETDPKVRELRIEELRNGWDVLMLSRSLGDAIRRGAPQDEIDRQTAVLRDLFARRYDLQVQVREHDIARLEERLERLRRETAQASAGRDAFAQQRTAEMLEAVRERTAREPAAAPRPGDGR